jgi:excisionase family DNA binding protein
MVDHPHAPGAEFLLVSEVAARLRCSPQYVTALARAAEIPAYRLGREWRIDAAAFEVWLKQQRSRKWRLSIGAARHGGYDFSGPAKRSGGLAEQALERRRKQLLQMRSQSSGA